MRLRTAIEIGIRGGWPLADNAIPDDNDPVTPIVIVTVPEPGPNVRVAKKNGVLIVHVRDTKGEKQNVDVTVPWAVAEALASNSTQNELNVEAAIQALERAGDMTLVTVTGDRQHVRVWIDSNSTAAE